MHISDWTIRTPVGDYHPYVEIFGSTLTNEQQEENLHIWFFASCAVLTLEPNALQNSNRLYAQLQGYDDRASPNKGREQAERVAAALGRRVALGHIRFEKIEPLDVLTSMTEPEAAVQQVQQELVEIDIALIDEGGGPVANERYELMLPNGRLIHGLTDESGRVWAPPMARGTCELTFPKLDMDSWDSV